MINIIGGYMHSMETTRSSICKINTFCALVDGAKSLSAQHRFFKSQKDAYKHGLALKNRRIFLKNLSNEICAYANLLDDGADVCDAEGWSFTDEQMCVFNAVLGKLEREVSVYLAGFDTYLPYDKKMILLAHAGERYVEIANQCKKIDGLPGLAPYHVRTFITLFNKLGKQTAFGRQDILRTYCLGIKKLYNLIRRIVFFIDPKNDDLQVEEVIEKFFQQLNGAYKILSKPLLYASNDLDKYFEIASYHIENVCNNLPLLMEVIDKKLSKRSSEYTSCHVMYDVFSKQSESLCASLCKEYCKKDNMAKLESDVLDVRNLARNAISNIFQAISIRQLLRIQEKAVAIERPNRISVLRFLHSIDLIEGYFRFSFFEQAPWWGWSRTEIAKNLEAKEEAIEGVLGTLLFGIDKSKRQKKIRIFLGSCASLHKGKKIFCQMRPGWQHESFGKTCYAAKRYFLDLDSEKSPDSVVETSLALLWLEARRTVLLREYGDEGGGARLFREQNWMIIPGVEAVYARLKNLLLLRATRKDLPEDLCLKTFVKGVKREFLWIRLTYATDSSHQKFVAQEYLHLLTAALSECQCDADMILRAECTYLKNCISEFMLKNIGAQVV